MLRYKVRRDKRSQAPIFDFEDKGYALLGEFLLAEGRNFGGEIMAFLEQGGDERHKAEWAGNVFSLEMDGDRVRVVNDITDRECVVALGELTGIVKDYVDMK